MIPTSPPPIPAELIQTAPIQPAPVQTVKSNPVITIKPPDAKQINESLMTGLAPAGKTLPVILLPGKVPGSIIQSTVTQPIILQPTQPVQILSVAPRLVTLDDLLIKRNTETEDYFTIRSAYSRMAMNVFGGKINAATAVLLGQMAADKVTYGVVYPEESDKVIRYINSQF